MIEANRMIQSDKLRRFSSPAVEIKNGVRNELQREIDEWLAQGNKISVVQSYEFVPKPIIERTERIQSVRKKYVPTSWDNKIEVQALKYMKACGLVNKEVAEALKKVFGTNRSVNAIRSFCTRHNVESLNPIGRKHKEPWMQEEDDLICRLAGEGISHTRIAESMAQQFPDRPWKRTWKAIRGRIERLELISKTEIKKRK
jgi:hypothetical protein